MDRIHVANLCQSETLHFQKYYKIITNLVTSKNLFIFKLLATAHRILPSLPPHVPPLSARLIRSPRSEHQHPSHLDHLRKRALSKKNIFSKRILNIGRTCFFPQPVRGIQKIAKRNSCYQSKATNKKHTNIISTFNCFYTFFWLLPEYVPGILTPNSLQLSTPSPRNNTY